MGLKPAVWCVFYRPKQKQKAPEQKQKAEQSRKKNRKQSRKEKGEEKCKGKGRKRPIKPTHASREEGLRQFFDHERRKRCAFFGFATWASVDTRRLDHDDDRLWRIRHRAQWSAPHRREPRLDARSKSHIWNKLSQGCMSSGEWRRSVQPNPFRDRGTLVRSPIRTQRGWIAHAHLKNGADEFVRYVHIRDSVRLGGRRDCVRWG